VINFSDNDIRKLDNFPPMPRLSSLLLPNNNITRISNSIHSYIPNLTNLILTNNKISSFVEIFHISLNKSLNHVSLLDNPICYKPNYRLYVIYTIPSLKSLDFVRVTSKERIAAKTFFSEVKAGIDFLATIQREIASVDGENVSISGEP